ncbi:MAG TPA: molybdopterin biosynthesis protein [Archaeoglobaceae archaeon]|nr:molybdopterin biosynthesis protein [Archaeoglobaceae archaeon]
MTRKIFRELISVDGAKKIISNLSVKPGTEVVDIFNSCNRVSARDVYAQIDIPQFDRATMDGYAVRAHNTFGAEEDNPVRLKVKGKIEAGDEKVAEVKEMEAIEISTGAAMPKGANAVVMVEYTHQIDDEVLVYRVVAPGENVIAAGSDIMAGELILRKNTRITARDVALLSAVGIKKVEVIKKPVIAVFSTGNELIEPGKELSYGKIYDINSAALCSAIEENGGRSLFIGIARDDYSEIKEKIHEGLKIADIVIASGGTSAGIGDLMHRILEEEGRILVHGIAIKPGKPTIIAEVKDKPVFGLPGYPVSAMMIFEVLVADLIRKMAGYEDERRKINARMGHKTFSSTGKREFLPVNIVGSSVYPVSGNYSAAISKLAETDGFIEIPENTVFLEEDEKVEVKLFSTLKPADLVIIGSHCVGIDIILEIMRRKYPWTVKVINAGSSGGLVAIRRGEADIAGTHLLDETTGEYNVSFIEKFKLKNVMLVKGYVREQGLILAKGNPKGIRGIEDFLRDDITIINRNPGSGTRVLLDMYLKEIAEKNSIEFDDIIARIDGYSIEAKSHTAVSAAVLMGKADVGLGIKTVADRYGLDFIPLRDEEYDFVVRKDSMYKKAVEEFLRVLKSEEFRRKLEERLSGMRITEKTGTILSF